jgi:thymidine phosphorylase
VADGSAEAAWRSWLEAQGGTADEEALERAPVVSEVRAPRAGAVTRLGAIAVGQAALHLGAGRRTKADAIDHAVGVVCVRKRGDEVAAGDVLAEVHARDDDSAAAAVREVGQAYELGDETPAPRPVLLEVID